MSGPDVREGAVVCRACGIDQLNHRHSYFSTSLVAFNNDRAQALRRIFVLGSVIEKLRCAVQANEQHVIRALHALTGGKTSSDPKLAATDRARAIWSEAARRGITMEQLVFLGNYSDSYRAQIAGKWTYFENLPIPPRLFAKSPEFADDKLLFKRFLIANGFPAAKGEVAAHLGEAKRKLEGLRTPVVVKPRIGSNSRHTTRMVRDGRDFDEAYNLAHQICREVLFEEHIFGNLCRATVVDSVLVGFLESRQPSVTGDGIHTIEELVDMKNASKHSGVAFVELSDEHYAHIARQGFSAGSIPEIGERVQVSPRPGRASGGDNREMPELVHPKLREAVEKAAHSMSAPVVGFDLIIEDPTADPDAQTWGIIEANTVPYIDIHLDPLYGEPSNVAAAIWDLWKKERSV